MTIRKFKRKLRTLFYGKKHTSVIFNKTLFLIDILLFSLFAIEAVYPEHSVVHAVEIIFAIIFTFEYIGRLWLAPKKLNYAFSLLAITDFIVIVSLLMPALVGNLAILRVIRTLRIFRTYRALDYLEKENGAIARNRNIIVGILNFFVFLFVMTVIVFVSQSSINANIGNHLDALYFTITTLTTTGFGDIIAVGTAGKMLSIIIMIFGVTLFIRLAQSIFRRPRIQYECPDCGLRRHELDASHCKHCGHVIKNEFSLE
ncbi:ion transporter [Patescibacteria group bacterium]